MKRILLAAVLCIVLGSPVQAQSKAFFSLKTGYAFNPTVELNDIPLERSQAAVFDLEGVYKLARIKAFHVETGVAGRLILASGEIDAITFNSQVLRFMIPVRVGYQVGRTWEVVAGLSFQNNEDVAGINLRERYFWRANYTMGSRYALGNKWYLVGAFSTGVRGSSDPFIVSDPKTALLVGVTRHL